MGGGQEEGIQPVKTKRIMSLDEILRKQRVLICCGPGGVGKTTLSAASALAAAELGRRVLVCTIDPARRLANAMGIARLDNQPREISFPTESPAKREHGQLWAMMLDAKRTFDGLIERYASSEAVRDRILGNSLYQTISNYLAGSQEYMAMEKLYELAELGKFDLIVLDTPPSQHAMDFLKAPRRVTDFLESGVLAWFVKASARVGRFGTRMVAKATGALLKRLVSIFGGTIFAEVAEFFETFRDLYPGFRRRAQEVLSLLKSAETSFLLVTSADGPVLKGTVDFYQKLRRQRFPVGAILVNRVVPWKPDRQTNQEAGNLARMLSGKQDVLPSDGLLEELTSTLSENVREFELRARAEDKRLREFWRHFDRGLPQHHIPDLAEDIHDLASLARISRLLLPH